MKASEARLKGVEARRDCERGVGGERRRGEKSLRNEVHNANAVVWEPVRGGRARVLRLGEEHQSPPLLLDVPQHRAAASHDEPDALGRDADDRQVVPAKVRVNRDRADALLEDERDVVLGAGHRGGVAGDEQLAARASALVAEVELRAGDARDLDLRGAALVARGTTAVVFDEGAFGSGRASERERRTNEGERNETTTNENDDGATIGKEELTDRTRRSRGVAARDAPCRGRTRRPCPRPR